VEITNLEANVVAVLRLEADEAVLVVVLEGELGVLVVGLAVGVDAVVISAEELAVVRLELDHVLAMVVELPARVGALLAAGVNGAVVLGLEVAVGKLRVELDLVAVSGSQRRVDVLGRGVVRLGRLVAHG
jgi:hypothetical protein